LKAEILVVVLILSAYLAVSTYHIDYETMISEESAECIFAVNILTHNRIISQPVGTSVNIFGTDFPLTQNGRYTFSLPDYFLVPAFFLFGISIHVYKISFILLVFFGLAALYYVVREMFGLEIALMSLLLLVINSSFIQQVRQPLNSTEPVINALFWGGLCLYFIYKKNGKNGYLFAAVFLLGSGLNVKLSIASRYIGLVLAGLIFYAVELKRGFSAAALKKLFILAAFFCAGGFLFVFFNFSTSGRTLKLARYLNLFEKVPVEACGPGDQNRRVLHNLELRFAQFNEMVEHGDIFWEVERTVPYCRILLCIFWVSFFANLFYLVYPDPKTRKRILFVYTFYTAMFLTSLFSPLNWRYIHLGILYPFPQFITALFIYNLYASKPGSRIPAVYLKLLSILILVLSVLAESAMLSVYLSRYDRTAKLYYGLGASLEKLAGYISENRFYPAYVLSNFVYEDLVLQSRGAVGANSSERSGGSGKDERIEDFQFCPENRIIFFGKIDEIVARHRLAYFVSDGSDYSLFGEGERRIGWLKEYAGKHNMRLMFEGAVNRRDGAPMYSIYRLEGPG